MLMSLVIYGLFSVMIEISRFLHFPLFINSVNDFPVIGDPCSAHRIMGSPGGNNCESLQRNVWCGVVSPLNAVSLDIECRILP